MYFYLLLDIVRYCLFGQSRMPLFGQSRMPSLRGTKQSMFVYLLSDIVRYCLFGQSRMPSLRGTKQSMFVFCFFLPPALKVADFRVYGEGYIVCWSSFIIKTMSSCVPVCFKK
jgi:hypothetical protein